VKSKERNQLIFQPVTGFDPEHGGDMFIRNVVLSPNHTALQLHKIVLFTVTAVRSISFRRRNQLRGDSFPISAQNVFVATSKHRLPTNSPVTCISRIDETDEVFGLRAVLLSLTGTVRLVLAGLEGVGNALF
jgi:hypothetical protein